MNDIIDFCKIM